MFLYLQHNAHSTQPIYETCFDTNSIKSIGYTNEPIQYIVLKEDELTTMSLAFAERSFAESWDINDLEQNAYWDSF